MNNNDFVSIDSLDEKSLIELPEHNELISRFKFEQSTNLVSDVERERIVAEMKFGRKFTDYMASAVWTKENGWENKKICAYENISLSPASAVLHYGQEVFEGLKAYRHADNSIWTFRPRYDAERFNLSANRMCMPNFDVEDFISSIVGLVNADKKWVPSLPGSALYLRPFMFADEAFLGVRAANS